MYRSDCVTVKDLRKYLEAFRDDAIVQIDVDNNKRATAFSLYHTDIYHFGQVGDDLLIEATEEGIEEEPEPEPDDERDARRDGVCVQLKAFR